MPALRALHADEAVLKYFTLLELFKLPRHMKGERLVLGLQLLQERGKPDLDCLVEGTSLGVTAPVLGRFSARTRRIAG